MVCQNSKKVARIVDPPKRRIRNITKVLSDELLETHLQLSPEEVWRITSGQITLNELDTLIPALIQGSHVDPKIAKHIPFQHRAVRDTYMSHIIRTFIQQLSLTQDIAANNHDVVRYANGEWTPTLEDFRYDFTQNITSNLNVEATRVITEGILREFTAGEHNEAALDGELAFPELNRRVKSHFRYLSTKVNMVDSTADGGIEAKITAKEKGRLCYRRNAVCATHYVTVNHISHILCRNSSGGLRLQTPSRRTGGSSSLSCGELARVICPMRRVSGIWQEFATSPSAPLNSAPSSPRSSLMPWMYWPTNWMRVEGPCSSKNVGQNMRGALPVTMYHRSSHPLLISPVTAMMPNG